MVAMFSSFSGTRRVFKFTLVQRENDTIYILFLRIVKLVIHLMSHEHDVWSRSNAFDNILLFFFLY